MTKRLIAAGSVLLLGLMSWPAFAQAPRERAGAAGAAASGGYTAAPGTWDAFNAVSSLRPQIVGTTRPVPGGASRRPGKSSGAVE
jgi:hypothetical protein